MVMVLPVGFQTDQVGIWGQCSGGRGLQEWFSIPRGDDKQNVFFRMILVEEAKARRAVRIS
jgi:hypothetical protein